MFTKPKNHNIQVSRERQELPTITSLISPYPGFHLQLIYLYLEIIFFFNDLVKFSSLESEIQALL